MAKHQYQDGECSCCGLELAVDKHHPDGRSWQTIKRDEGTESIPFYAPVNPDDYYYLCPLCHRLLHRGMNMLAINSLVKKSWVDTILGTSARWELRDIQKRIAMKLRELNLKQKIILSESEKVESLPVIREWIDYMNKEDAWRIEWKP